MDDFEKKLYEILIKESLHTLFSSTKALKKWLSDQNKKYDLLGIFAKRYGKSLYENVNAIKVLGMESPIELSSILVNVNILQKIVSRHPNTVEALEMTLEKDQRGFSPIITSMDGVEYANMTDKFLVLGKPGAGKTTFLKTITLQTLDGKINKGNIPFLISLKDFSEEGVSFEDYLENQLEECGVPEAKVFVQRILEAGSALLLLDGLDEITSDAFETIKKTRKFSQKYGKCKYVISCRTASYNFWFEKFEDIEIADFDDEQILNFTRNWFRETPKSVEKFHQELNQNFHLKELAKTPLLLTLLCISFQQNLGFPPNRAELFEESIQLLLKKWDSQREIKREEPYKFLSISRKIVLLTRLAAQTFQKDDYFIKKKQLVAWIKGYFDNYAPEEDRSEVDHEAILKAIEAHHGLLVERAKNIFSFSHLTFQEFFTAKYLVDNYNNKKFEKFLTDNFFLPKWREVILMCIELLPDADFFVKSILKLVDSQAEKPWVNEVLSDIDFASTRRIRGYSHPTAKRAIAFMLLLMEEGVVKFDYIGDTAKNPDEYLRDQKKIIEPETQIKTVREALMHTDRILGIVQGHQLSPVISNLRLTGYVYGLHLLVECLKSDAIISNSVKEEALGRILHMA